MAGVYTEIKEKVSHTIYYSYVCQHCGKESGMLSEELTASATKRKDGYNAKFSDKDRSGVYEKAVERLQTKFDDRRAKAAEGNYSDFYGVCPHCGKSQKWSVGSFSKDVIGATLLLTFGVAFFGLGITIVLYALLENFVSAKVAFTIYGVIVAIACGGSFALTLKIWIKNKRDTKGITNGSIPEINWNVQ